MAHTDALVGTKGVKNTQDGVYPQIMDLMSQMQAIVDQVTGIIQEQEGNGRQAGFESVDRGQQR